MQLAWSESNTARGLGRVLDLQCDPAMESAIRY